MADQSAASSGVLMRAGYRLDQAVQRACSPASTWHASFDGIRLHAGDGQWWAYCCRLLPTRADAVAASFCGFYREPG